MKKLIVCLSLLFFSFPFIAAQGTNLLDLDFDSLFNETVSDIPREENDGETAGVLDSVRRRGLTLNASYEFHGGIAPGWDTSPWFFDGDEKFSWGQGIKMLSSLSLTAQISDVFRVISVFNFNIPSFNFSIGDFFFDYNFLNAVFVRAGKYENAWGISPNFGFTNLLSRVPENGSGGPSYVFKTDIPIGVGGFQLLVLTRSDFMSGVVPGWSDIGFGGKFNLALRWADFDLGLFYQDNMATRGFFSVKTTIGKTELYNEWLLAVNTHSDNGVGFAANLGFARDFFGSKFSVNGEFFYNGEEGAFFFRPETELMEEDTVQFIDGITLALKMLYRFRGNSNPRLFMDILYSPSQSSAQLVPGFRITPLENIDFYMAVPMAFGPKTGYYYNNTIDANHRPFSIILLVILRGSVQA
jgi:hypothetical protein